MNVSTDIKKKIARLNIGEVFTYDSLGIESSQFLAASKALSRLVSKGEIRRYQKGVYYKPQQSVFGELKPKESELLKIYLYESQKQVAYITGISLYNSLGLTTQVPKTIRIASNTKQIKGKVGATLIKPAKSYIAVTKRNVPLLQLLDVAKDFKKIPDANRSKIIQFLKNKIDALSTKDLEKFTTFAKAYPPKVSALIGAILEALNLNNYSQLLKERINYLSTYSFGITEKQLPTINNWNIA